MPDLRRTRKNLKVALAILAGVDLLAAIIYFSPLVGSAETGRSGVARQPVAPSVLPLPRLSSEDTDRRCSAARIVHSNAGNHLHIAESTAAVLAQ